MTVEETLEHDAREGSLPSSAGTNSSQPQQGDSAQARRGEKAKSRAAKAAAAESRIPRFKRRAQPPGGDGAGAGLPPIADASAELPAVSKAVTHAHAASSGLPGA